MKAVLVCVLLFFVLASSTPCQVQAPDPGPIEQMTARVDSLRSARNYVEAEAAARELLAEIEETGKPESPQTAGAMVSLIWSVWGVGEATKAEARALTEKAVGVHEKVWGQDHPRLADTLIPISLLLSKTRDHELARLHLERALRIYEQVPEPDFSSVARTLGYLGDLAAREGDYVSARGFMERALETWKRARGPNDLDVAGAHLNFAPTLAALGRYEEARRHYQQSLDIKENALGRDHPDVAYVLTGLANLTQELGDFEEACPLWESVLEIYEKCEDRRASYAMAGLASCFEDQGDCEAAKRLYKRALQTTQEGWDPDHPVVASRLTDLALLLQTQRDYASARPLLERALQIFQKEYDPDHACVADPLHILATLFLDLDDFERARPLLEHAFAIREKSFGPNHPDVAKSLQGLARLFCTTGEIGKALEATLRAEDIGREHFYLMAQSQTERRALEYASVRQSGLDLALSLVCENLPSESVARIWDAQICARALILDEMAARYQCVHGLERSSQPLSRLAAAQAQLRHLLDRGPGEDPPEEYQNTLGAARRKVEEAEAAVAETKARLYEPHFRRQIGFNEVASHLPAGAALVAYSLYEPLTSKESNGPYYLALVLADRRKGPVGVSIGPAAEIDSLIGAWKTEAGLEKQSLKSETHREVMYRSAGKELRQRIWDPAAQHLGDAHQIFLVPAGALNLVSFATLPVGESGYLIEHDPHIHYLTAERDLVPLRHDRIPAEGLLAIGGPDFEASQALTPGEHSAGLLPAPVSLSPSRHFQRGVSHSNLASLRFFPLPEARREIEELRVLRGSAGKDIFLSGKNASETAFKTHAPGRRVLHIATHGFFLPDDCGPGVHLNNPLHLSGLALAGANQRATTKPGQEDGMLLAEEISVLDLSAVEWAVLSACDTGVGEVRNGEGVFGLRRAFQVAGVGTVIMSLWSVDDEATREWMRELYEGRFEKRLDTAGALRRASLSVLRERREEGRSTHPFYWGAFVAVGDWR